MSDSPSSLIDETFALNRERPRVLTPAEIKAEKERCTADITYFINRYCKIYDSLTSDWVPFKLWPSQIELLHSILNAKYSLVPKARQLGISWLLGDALPLYLMLFKPVAEVLLFSQRDDEAIKLLERLKGTEESQSTFSLLPDWMKPKAVVDNSHEFKLSNGSRIQALPSTAGGRSNTVTLVIIDEADFILNLQSLITAAKPTIDAGSNRMVVLSTINEETPNSYFQRLCNANAESEGAWKLNFLGWRAHPGRTDAWYEDKKTACLTDNGTLDPLYKEYPATLKEALAPRELNKRFPPDWILALSGIRKPVPLAAMPDAPPVPGLKIYKVPESGKKYGIGADPGGGKLDPSVAQVVNADTREQVAVLSGLVEPTQFANHVYELSQYYFSAPVLFELNNHGHAFLSQSKERGTPLKPGIGRRGQKDREPGWLTTERSKHMLFDVGAKVMQEIIAICALNGTQPEPILCDSTTVAELTSIEISTLEAPEGMHDDHAMGWVLACMCVYRGIPSVQQVPFSGLYHKRGDENEPAYSGPGSDLPMRKPYLASRRDEVMDTPAPKTERDSNGVPKHILERFGRYGRGTQAIPARIAEVTDILVKDVNPAALDETINTMGAIVLQYYGEAGNYRQIDGCYIVRVYGGKGDFVRFAMEKQGYATVVRVLEEPIDY